MAEPFVHLQGRSIPVERLEEGGDLRERVEERVEALLDSVRSKRPAWNPPPYDPVMIAEHLGIPVTFAKTPPGCDAMLVPTGRGFQILCDPSVRSRGRIRFSIAHELAHTFFDEASRDWNRRSSAGVDERALERLCDHGAAAIVMPRRAFRACMDAEGERAPSVSALALRFAVSREAAAVRMVECGSSRLLGVGFFAYGTRLRGAGTPGDRHAYRVRRVFTKPGVPYLFPPGKSVPDTSAIYRASIVPGESRGVERFELGGASGRFEVSAVSVRGRAEGPPGVCGVLREAV